MTRHMKAAALALAVGFALAACGDDDGSTSAGSGEGTGDAGGANDGAAQSAEFPVTVESAGGTVEIAEQPDRIVSLSATATEMLFAIDAGDQVVAVDDQSNYPDDAPVTDLSGLEPNVEAIAGYEPDLVVTSGDPGDVVAGLETLGVPTLVHPAAATLDDTYDQITSLGTATGHGDDAAEVVEQMEDDIAALVDQVPDHVQALTYYHELDSTLFTVTSETFIGELYELAGFVNVADPADDGTAGGYPQLSPEFLVEADPDVIFLADTKCCGQDATTIASRPGWSGLTAVTEGNVVELDDDIASRWGPRVVDLLETLVDTSMGMTEPVS
jgi:iron complex transport system substrate-binding protein